MSFAIDVWGFTNWLGQPPRLVNNHVRVFTKPGQNGISAQLLGIHGDPFEVELYSAWPDQSSSLAAFNGYRFLIGAGPVNVIHNDVHYYAAFGHRYLVLNVTTVELKCLPRQICSLPSGGFDYIGGWLLKSRWALQPFT